MHFVVLCYIVLLAFACEPALRKCPALFYCYIPTPLLYASATRYVPRRALHALSISRVVPIVLWHLYVYVVYGSLPDEIDLPGAMCVG